MSWDINQVFLIGRLTGDPVLRYSSQGNAYCQLNVAVGRKSFSKEKQEDEVFFFNVMIFGRMAEISGEYLTKGKQIGISGYLRQRRWEKDGAKLSAIDVICERIQFLSPTNKKDKPDFNNQEEFTGSIDYKEKSLHNKKKLKEKENNFNEVDNEDLNEDEIPF